MLSSAPDASHSKSKQLRQKSVRKIEQLSEKTIRIDESQKTLVLESLKLSRLLEMLYSLNYWSPNYWSAIAFRYNPRYMKKMDGLIFL